MTGRLALAALAAAALLALAGCRTEVPTFPPRTAAAPAPPIVVEPAKEPGMVHATDPGAWRVPPTR